MKFYVHCEEQRFTMVARMDESRQLVTMDDIMQLFIVELKKKTQSKLDDKDISVSEIKCRYKRLDMSTPVHKNVKYMDDVFVKLQISPKKHSPADGKDKKAEKQEVKPKKSKSGEENIIKLTKVDRLMIRADDQFKKGNLGDALVLYEEVLENDSKHFAGHLGLVGIYLRAERPKKALAMLKKVKFFSSNDKLPLKEAECYLALKKPEKALKLTLDYCKSVRNFGGADTQHKHSVHLLLAKAYQGKGQDDMAIAVLQGILREEKNHPEATIEFSPHLFRLGDPSQKEDALSVMLTYLIGNKEHTYIKEKFVSMCQEEDGMRILQSVAKDAWRDVPAVVFLATTLRDCGAIKESLQLLDHAYNLQPENPNTLLTYIHTMELVEQHSEAVDSVKKYIKNFPQKKVGNFTCEMMIPIIEKMKGDIYLNNSSDMSTYKSPTVLASDAEYTDEEKYLLALLFTLVKILYVKGSLKLIPYLTQLLDPCCKNRELHTTNIRNENAYFSCISKIVQRDDMSDLSTTSPFVYFVGDSHCITPAWRNITLNEKTFTVHPILSTGTKIWHLRDESKFYPKTNFYSAIDEVPDNSIVVMCFGEIDCREAILYCVQQCRYDTLEEAYNAVIDIYIDVLLKLQKENHWDIHVHPVMPILDITRDVVIPFNEHLEKRVRNQSVLHWLNFATQLVTQEGEVFRLKPEYEFDGTHCNPDYLPLLQEALQSNLQTKVS